MDNVVISLDTRGKVYEYLLAYQNHLKRTDPDSAYVKFELWAIDNQEEDLKFMINGRIVAVGEVKYKDLYQSVMVKKTLHNEIIQYAHHNPEVPLICFFKEPSKKEFAHSKFDYAKPLKVRRLHFREVVKRLMYTYRVPHHYVYECEGEWALAEKIFREVYKYDQYAQETLYWEFEGECNHWLANTLQGLGFPAKMAGFALEYFNKQTKYQLRELWDVISMPLDAWESFNEAYKKKFKLSAGKDFKRWREAVGC